MVEMRVNLKNDSCHMEVDGKTIDLIIEAAFGIREFITNMAEHMKVTEAEAYERFKRAYEML